MRNEPLRIYLEDTLGVQVEIFTAGNYDGVIQAIAADQIEIARLDLRPMRRPIPPQMAVSSRR